jgi:predicted Zn-dependent protease
MIHHFRRRLQPAALWLAGLLAVSAGGVGCGKGTVWSTKDEVKIGQDVSREVEKRYRIDHDSEDAKRVKRIAERLVGHTDAREGVPYSFKVIDTKDVNAVSLPGGPIYVFRGLMDLLGDDDDALAGVLAHEIAHTNARHISKQYTKQLQTNLLLAVLLSGQGRLVQDLASLGAEIFALKFSRDDEYDADRRGLSYSKKAGFDPMGLVRFFEKLQELDKRGGTPEFLRTHPVTKSRIDRALKMVELNDYKFGK